MLLPPVFAVSFPEISVHPVKCSTLVHKVYMYLADPLIESLKNIKCSTVINWSIKIYSRVYASLRIIHSPVSSGVKLTIITNFVCYSHHFDCTCRENKQCICFYIYLPIVIFRENLEYEKSDLIKGNGSRNPLARKIKIKEDRKGKKIEGNHYILLTSLS